MADTKSSLTKKLLAYGFTAAVALSGGYLIAPNEGKVNATYIDPVGIATSCYGHTGPELKLGQKYTDDQCLDQLAKDLSSHDKQMMNLVRVPLTDYQHAAFLSFTYNVGVGNFKSSTMLRKLNSKDYEGACEELSKWVYAKKQKLNGLVTRRQQEKDMCLGKTKVEIVPS
ncbi:MAG: lysozyme [Chitinophagaceae bacterium]|nr:MAG: lysozyme [Chitinophagaceae bacterium]